VFVVVDAQAPTSIAYITPGSYTFTVPDNATSINVEVWGGGGGGSADNGNAGTDGGESSFNKTIKQSGAKSITASGGKGGAADSRSGKSQGGDAGRGSGGTDNERGVAGESASSTVYGGAGGAAAEGGSGGARQMSKLGGNDGFFPGGGGGGSNLLSYTVNKPTVLNDRIAALLCGNKNVRFILAQCNSSAQNASSSMTVDATHGAGGGGGGYASRTYTTKDLKPGSKIAVVVGAGGRGASYFMQGTQNTYRGGNGAPGKVRISWGITLSPNAPTPATSTTPTDTNPVASTPIPLPLAGANSDSSATTTLELFLKNLGNVRITDSLIAQAVARFGTTTAASSTISSYLKDKKNSLLSNTIINTLQDRLQEAMAQARGSTADTTTSEDTSSEVSDSVSGAQTFTGAGTYTYVTPSSYSSIVIKVTGMGIVGEQKAGAKNGQISSLLMLNLVGTDTRTYSVNTLKPGTKIVANLGGTAKGAASVTFTPQ
jgi:hypothetical protein